MTLIYLSAAWMAGIFLASQIQFSLAMWGLASLLSLGVACLWRRDARIRLVSLCFLFVLLGAIRFTLALPRSDERSVATYNEQGPVILVGVVAAEPDVRDTYTNLRLRAETLALVDGGLREVRGLVLVRAPRYPERRYGDRLEVHGQLETPPVLEGFSYRDYLARQGIYSMVRWARITMLGRGQGSPFLALLLLLKRHAQNAIASTLHEPYAALLTGILLGVDNGLPTDVSDAFRITGTSHIIAISGFNMALVAGVFSSLAVRVAGRRSAAWFATAAIAVYTVLVGASAAVVRAAVMGCIAVWGQHVGRQNSAPNALLATALIMTGYDPHTLWDIGFQLSFAATLGLMLFADPLGRAFQRLLSYVLPGEWVEGVSGFLHESLVLTTAAQLTTLPIIAYHFRSLSLVTLVSNALILPVQPQVMLWGAVAAVGGLIWIPLGQVLGWVAWPFLAYTVWMVETTARASYAAVELGEIHPMWVWGWYVTLGAGAWWMAVTEERRQEVWRALTMHLPAKALAGSLGIVAVLVWLAAVSLPDGKAHATFLDVGEGDAVLVETPAGRQVLVNGGPSPSRLLGHLGRRLPFWDRRLDVVILTDPGDEHLLGLISVLERYEVEQVLHPPLEDCASPACTRWRELLRQKGIAAQQPIAGMQIDLGDGVTARVLYPSAQALGADRPDGESVGVVLRVDYGQTCFLLAGSADRAAETAMLASGEPVRCDALQVAQHGRAEASGVAFLEAVRPVLAVVSAGEEQRSKGPAAEVLERLIQQGATVVRTDEHGSVKVTTDGKGYTVRVDR